MSSRVSPRQRTSFDGRRLICGAYRGENSALVALDELFMLQFQPFEAEMKRFALEVIPRVRRAETAAA